MYIVKQSALKWGKEVHAYIRHGGFESDVRVGTALLTMYSKCGSIEAARKTFDKLGSRDDMSWNVMIGAYAESGCGEEAYGLLLQMTRDGFKPDAGSYMGLGVTHIDPVYRCIFLCVDER
jgi:pentatricopeptide repeat protein